MTRLFLAMVSALPMVLLGAATASAQRDSVHFQYSIDMPLGSIGRQQLLRGGPLAGYFQPVEIRAQRGAHVAWWVDDRFERSDASTTMAGVLIGHAYRLKVTHIWDREGLEVYPTVEVIDRLYPPRGLETRFPIPIEISQEELEMALDGQFITRVIYLEDPTTAMPIREDPRRQRYFEVHPGVDPLHVADRLGRPMAILRMGSRVPDSDGVNAQFVHGSPPLMKFESPSPPVEFSPPVEPIPSGEPVPSTQTGAPANRPASQSFQPISAQRYQIWRGAAARNPVGAIR